MSKFITDWVEETFEEALETKIPKDVFFNTIVPYLDLRCKRCQKYFPYDQEQKGILQRMVFRK